MSLPSEKPKVVTIADVRSFIQKTMEADTKFSEIGNPQVYLMQKILEHFQGSISPIILRPLVLIEVYKNDVPRMIIEEARRSSFELRDYCLDYPDINERLDHLDKILLDILDTWNSKQSIEEAKQHLDGLEEIPPLGDSRCSKETM